MTKQEVNKISKMPVEIEDLKKFFEEYLENPKKEKYGLSWAGKVNAKKEALIPTSKTLSPQEDESKDWDDTENVFIEGDNLDALKLLQRKYFEKIKMIYIDPPYNTGKDFIYRDNFSRSSKEELEESGEMVDGKLLTTNVKTNGRFHSDWLNMMYSRLFLAHKLLKDDGVIFVSIDDNEVANLRLLMDEIFGEENFVATFPRITKKAGKTSDLVSKNNDYIICFRKTESSEFNSYKHTDKEYKYIDDFVEERGKYKLSQTLDYGSIQYSPSLDYEIKLDGKIFRPGGVSKKQMEERKKTNPKSDYCWRWSKELFNFGLKNGFIVVKESRNGTRIYTKTYKNAIISKNEKGYFVENKKRERSSTTLDFIENKFSNDNSKKEFDKIFDDKIFDYPKPVKLIKSLAFLTTNNDDVILDFFAGSGTTAHAVMDLNAEDQGNRKYICVQLDEEVDEKSEAGKAGYKNIAEIARERIRRAGDKILENKQKELTKREKPLDIGFRSFKVSNSNYRKWEEGDFDMFEEKLLEQAKLFMDKPLIDNYKEINVVFEIIVKEGFALSSKISHKDDVWEIKDNNRKMIIDFGKKINPEKVEKLNLNENDIFVCFDSALNDSDKVNLTKSINLKVV